LWWKFRSSGFANCFLNFDFCPQEQPCAGSVGVPAIGFVSIADYALMGLRGRFHESAEDFGFLAGKLFGREQQLR
jgi:hypothetical protein